MSARSRIFWPDFLAVVVLDRVTKHLVVASLTPHVPRDVFGPIGRLTLSYNTGAVFGIPLGPWTRIALIIITLLIIGMLFRIYLGAAASDWPLALALGLVCGGAVGNLIDRVATARGAVDFIEIGVGATRFWTFNAADSGITIGAILLAILLWRRDRERPSTATHQ